MLATPMLATQQLQAAQRGTRQGRWLAGGVDVGAGELDQALNQLLTASHKGTRRTASFAQRADQYRHLFMAQAEMFDDPPAVTAQGAQAMGIIDHQPGVAGLGCGGQRRQVGKVAIHAEHPIGDH
ncbi:hypothetical protein D3C72_2041120 [compost metagenome]